MPEKTETLSMSDPCSHVTRLMVIAAKLHGHMDLIEAHLREECQDTEDNYP